MKSAKGAYAFNETVRQKSKERNTRSDPLVYIT